MPVFRGGKALVDVTYAGNVADAMLLCDRTGAPPGTFNITNGEPVSIEDLLRRVFAALDLNVRLVPMPYRALDAAAGAWELAARAFNLKKEPKLLRYPLGLMTYSQTLDISAARQQLGYAPAICIDDGLRRFATWYRQEKANAAPRATPHGHRMAP